MEITLIDQMDLGEGQLRIVVVAEIPCLRQERFFFQTFYDTNRVEIPKAICQGFHKMIHQDGRWNIEAQTELLTAKEEKYLQVCDCAGIPLAVGDIVQNSSKQGSGLAGIIWIRVDESQKNREVIVTLCPFEQDQEEGDVYWDYRQRWEHKAKDNSNQTGSPFLKQENLRKLTCKDNQWCVATLKSA